ncbi:hypothetical protein HPB47_023810 [Ixodes persulcatus]|uniref:Uncharacterized protein n=1 Tax=Ixodes persulcatus TaxID=34615 RepID=A0AC60Q751_IXOPE|nr:hypothetical protein HPB47_023810 [Ixodes persulcatus]
MSVNNLRNCYQTCCLTKPASTTLLFTLNYSKLLKAHMGKVESANWSSVLMLVHSSKYFEWKCCFAYKWVAYFPDPILGLYRIRFLHLAASRVNPPSTMLYSSDLHCRRLLFGVTYCVPQPLLSGTHELSSTRRSFSSLQKNRSIFDNQEPTYRPELLGASSFGTPKIPPKPASADVECVEPAIIDDDASMTDDPTPTQSLGAVQGMTYELPPPSAYVGVIRGVSTKIADAERCAALREKAPVIQSSHTRKNHGNVRSVTASGILQVPALKRSAVADVEANTTSARGTQFRALVGDPDIIYPTPPPYAPPLNIIESVPALKSKRSTSQPVVRSLVEDHVETSFAGWLRVYTDGSVLHSQLNMTESRKLSFYTTSTTAELLQLASASLLHRLRTGCAFTAKALHRINSAVDPHCPTCDVLEDFDHLLWDCPTKFFFPRVRPRPLLNHSLLSSHS